MKQKLGALFILLFLAGLSASWMQPVPPAPQAAPERQEPHIELVRSATGAREVLPMEEYVAGVVAAEMDSSFPPAALAAQAILARTYAARRWLMGESLVDDHRVHQAYNPSRLSVVIRQAVAETRGIVVTHQGELVDAVYHACAGGKTSGAGEGMEAPERAYLRPVADPPCRQNETWTARFGARQVAAVVGLTDPVRQVAIGRKGPSGRALTLVINGKEANAIRVRSALGGTRMKSTYLTRIAVSGDSVVIEGRGYGHGVGLSQWGAAALAEKGFTPEEIIRHYFTNVEI